jgi:hypothetical protein
VPPPARDDTENACRSPSYYAQTDRFATHPPAERTAAQRVAPPAIALIVTGAIGIVLQAVAALVQIIQLGAGGEPAEAVGMLIGGGVGIVVSAVVIAGGAKMKRLESYGLAMTSSILAMIPCCSPCCLLGLPFGIWALVVLMDPSVKAAFRN